MSLECEYALLGTGLAPLLSAQSLIRQGHSVLLLNPDHDFFRENSEMPLEPLLAGSLHNAIVLKQVELQRLEKARSVLAPEFPGALEEWPRDPQQGAYRGFRDPDAPFLRARRWNWVPPTYDDAFLRFLDAGWNPQLTQGLVAARGFPGYNWQRNLSPSFQTLSLDRLVDVDLDRYRNGILEFVRSRVSPERMLTSASGLELNDQNIRFFHRGATMHARVKKGLWVFWTPRLTAWLEKLCANHKQERLLPAPPLTAWEQWSLRSREPIDSTQVGITEDGVAWASCHGEPREPRLELDVLMPAASGGKLAAAESFQRLGRFVQNFLNWEHFCIRDLKTRVLLGLPPQEWVFHGAQIPVRVMSGSDGALVGLVERVVRFSEKGAA
ncbi:MAG: hypothetical protein KGQ59_08315 [Bdellovibrionales bacterium]|nr:hypothetical protein [Bdellovibrionales bacterium]